MSGGALADLICVAPRLASPAAARRRLAGLLQEADGAALANLLAEGRSRDLILGLADHSPYLWGLVVEDPSRLMRLLATPPQQSLDRLIAAMAGRRDDDEAELMRALRLAKRESALLIALADIGGVDRKSVV